MPGQQQIFSVNELDTFGPMTPQQQQQIPSSIAPGPGVVASNAPGINSAALAMANGGHSSPGKREETFFLLLKPVLLVCDHLARLFQVFCF